ncbi:hypothetical protein Tco_0712904 [Tanacetum coccineum]
MIPKPFKECKYCGFNDHHSDNCEYYPGCEVCGSVAHEPADCPKKHPNRLPKEVTQKDMDKSTVMESLSPGLLIDHLGKFDKKDDDGFFLGYSLVAKAFRKGMQSIVEPRSKVTQCSANIEYFPYIPSYENTTPTDSPILQDLSLLRNTGVHCVIIPQPSSKHDQFESGEAILQTLVPQDRWSREKHIELVSIIGEPLASITTRSKVRDSDAASAHECLYVNFLSEIEPKKLIEALKEG